MTSTKVNVINSENGLSQCVVNYQLCVFCQTLKKLANKQKETLVDPFKKKGKNVSESYDLIVAILKVRFNVFLVASYLYFDFHMLMQVFK